MGQIIIDIPANKTLHYEVFSKNEYKELVKFLDGFSLLETDAEDEEDYKAGMEALQAKARNEFVKWEEVRVKL
jgi:hypothetical protein